MKVVAKKIYYTETIFAIPRQCYKEGEKPAQQKPKIVYKKGDFKEWEVEAKEWCCEELKDLDQEYNIVKAKDYWSSTSQVGVFLPFQGWDEPDWEKIKYCPYCGEKVVVEIEEQKREEVR